MSHPENLWIHAQHMKARAAALKNGDDEARRHAEHLEREAQEIEQRLPRSERGGS